MVDKFLWLFLGKILLNTLEIKNKKKKCLFQPPTSFMRITVTRTNTLLSSLLEFSSALSVLSF